MTFEQGHAARFHHHDPIYTAYRHFYDAFSADWSVRTEDPWEANMFYVPALVQSASGECSGRRHNMCTAWCNVFQLIADSAALVCKVGHQTV